jgi:pyridoxal phosphate enzyme (YggS family)
LAPNAPNIDQATIAANLDDVRRRISVATARAGRRGEDVTLIAVSKTYPPAAVLAALRCGQAIFGENRVQEAAAKFPSLRLTHADLRLHVIGGLQTNKAREAVRVADVIESLDRPRLADALVDAFAREGRTIDLFVQVNVGDEPQKSGVARSGADAFIDNCMLRFGASLVGLMCVPPLADNPEPHFAWLAQCACRHGLAGLSMGMSADFEVAIAHGATHIRIGSAIFGSRPKA